MQLLYFFFFFYAFKKCLGMGNNRVRWGHFDVENYCCLGVIFHKLYDVMMTIFSVVSRENGSSVEREHVANKKKNRAGTRKKKKEGKGNLVYIWWKYWAFLVSDKIKSVSMRK